MKLEVTVSGIIYDDLESEIDSIKNDVLKGLKPSLKIGEFQPGELVIPECTKDYNGDDNFVYVVLNHVTVKAGRDFKKARDDLEGLFEGLIQKYCESGTKVGLFVMLVTDRPYDETGSCYVEGPYKIFDVGPK